MLIADSRSPDYDRLRPFKPRTTSTFPVYPDLVDRLATTVKHPDPIVAHVMATAAAYAYSDALTVATIMARMGLEDNHCRMIAESVDAMFISSTSFLVQSRDGRVLILCYRGTKPEDVVEWLTNANISPEKIAITLPDATGTYDVHGGYYRNVRATRFEVVAALQRALEGRTVDGNGELPHKLEAFYITGHSLGGAMAALMAVMLMAEEAYEPLAQKLRAVYTIGQTMVGDPEFARACDNHPFLGTSVIRYIYRHDVAPQFPPTAAGPFAHFGPEYQYVTRGGGGHWRRNATYTGQLASLGELIGAPLAFLARQVPILRHIPFQASLDDHFPQHYLSALTPPGVHSEFGD